MYHVCIGVTFLSRDTQGAVMPQMVNSLFLQHVLSVCPSVRPSDTRWHSVKITEATVMRSSLHCPMTLVSSRLTSSRTSDVNLGSGVAE